MNIIGEIDVLSDTHGNNNIIYRWIRESNASNLISCGDDGSGFIGYDDELTRLGTKLNQASKNLYIIRGNHSDPEYFDGRKYGGDYGGVYLVQDGLIMNWNKEKILFNGGGLSLDRSVRIEGIDYWEDESFKFIEVKEKVDHLVTHISLTAIHGQQINNPFVLSWASRDADLITDLYKEQQELQVWIDYLLASGSKIKSWHYGHYHKSIESKYGDIYCRCLAINEIRPFNRPEYESY